MAFFIDGARLENQLVCGVAERMTKANKPFVMLTVCDDEGNSNQFSTSDPQTMAEVRNLRQGQHVNLVLVIAGGPNKQYAMISRRPNSVVLSDAAYNGTEY